MMNPVSSQEVNRFRQRDIKRAVEQRRLVFANRQERPGVISRLGNGLRRMLEKLSPAAENVSPLPGNSAERDVSSGSAA
jgi:hypothetical protein